MNKFRRLRRNKEATKKNINKVKSFSLKIALIMLNFIFATFAWFTYMISLDTTVEVKVSTWKVDFKENNTSIGESIEFQVSDFYPGMEDYIKEIKIENLGERAATISYDIKQLKILGTVYEVKDTVGASDSAYTVYKSETDTVDGKKQIKLLNDSTKFPFEVTIVHTTELGIVDASNPEKNKGSFQITLTWPYELEGTATQAQKDQKDALDTKWGHDTATFYNNLAEGDTTKALEITIQAIAKQII